MATPLSRTGWMQLFTQMRLANAFLTRHFTVKPGNIYSGEKITIDIERYGEQVAVAIQACTGPNMNDFDEFTNKEFTPPEYGEAFPVDVCSLLKRMAGVDPYSAAYNGYAAQLIAVIAKGFMIIDQKIRRAVELQAAQILQTGMLTLTDNAGNPAYDLDFKPKASHFPTVTVDWGQPGATPLADIAALAEVIRNDGKVEPNRLIFGENALSNFLNNQEVKDQINLRRAAVIEIAPRFAEAGATFWGMAWIGCYDFEIWCYKDTYDDPQTGLPTKYVDTNKVIVVSVSANGITGTRLDMTSAEVPLPLGPDPRVANLMPGRVTNNEAGFDVTPNLYSTPNGRQVMGELWSRPLLIPVQIDGFGCLLTQMP